VDDRQASVFGKHNSWSGFELLVNSGAMRQLLVRAAMSNCVNSTTEKARMSKIDSR